MSTTTVSPHSVFPASGFSASFGTGPMLTDSHCSLEATNSVGGVELTTDTARLLIIDDEPINARIIENVLRKSGYRHVMSHIDSQTALLTISAQRPDAVICDVCMPVSGMDILRAVVTDPVLMHVPMIMLTASDDESLRAEALELGATDLLSKPVRATELLPRVRNALVIRSHVAHLQSYSHQLEREVRRRTSELLSSRTELIHCLARLAEYRDNETGRHVIRVGRYSGLIARQLGLNSDLCELIEHAAPLHDIGKIGIPDSILLKEGKLTPEEYEIMQRHVALGKRAFEPMSSHEMRAFRSHTVLGEMMINVSESPLLSMAAEIALTHHERWDGAGYPIGLAGEEIPISGRIVAVADVFDALSNKRPYKPAFPIEKCFSILDEESGAHFDPRVIEAFKQIRDEIVQVRIALADID